MTRMCVVLSHLGHLCQLVSVAAPQSLLECPASFSPASLPPLLDLLLSPLGTAACDSVAGDCQCRPLVSGASVTRVTLEQPASPPVGVSQWVCPRWQCGPTHSSEERLCTCKVSTECGVYPTPVCMWCGPCTNNIYTVYT